MAEVLELRGVDKAFGRLKALSGIDLVVAAGEVVALIGPPGSGKTALLHLAMGLDVPDRGSVRVAGRDVRRLSAPARRDIGAVFDDTALEPDQSVRANLRYAADLLGLRRADAAARASGLMERFSIRGHERDRVRSLGRPEHRRLEIVVAVLHRPRLLFLSDVGVDLERSQAVRLLTDVRALAAEEKTAVLWATSRAGEAAGADRVIVLRRGGVGFAGTPAELMAKVGRTDLGGAVAALLLGDAPAA